MSDDIKSKLIQKLKSSGYQDHRFSLTRRELIKMGLIAGGGALLPLSFTERLLAQTSAGAKTPFLVFDLAGGASLPGNFLVGQKGGPEDLCQNYGRMGWNPRAKDALDRTFGLPMAKQESRMLAGLKETLPVEIAGNENQTFFKMASFCHFSLDDTNTNRASAITMIAKSGLRGSLFRSGIGQLSSNSGANSDVYLQDSKFKPKAVSTAEDIAKLTSFGRSFEEMDPKQRAQIFANLQTAAGNNGLMKDMYTELSKIGVTDPKLDVTKNSQIAGLYQVTSNTSPQAMEAGIVYNVVSGQTGPGALTIGGCDYHDNTQTTGDNKDRDIGRAIGRAVHTAFLLKKPLFIQIITDGGVYAPDSSNFERKWLGDSNQHSMSVIGYFHPTRPVEMRKHQVGHYTNTGVVELKTQVGSGPERMALGTLVNYLNLYGALEQLEEVANVRLQSNEIDELLVFG